MRLLTKYILISPLVFLSTACAVQQQNGNDIRLEQPFVLSEQHWQITQQVTTANDDHICTVSSGELGVTQRSHDNAIVQQVGTSDTLTPGESYKVIVGEHSYESAQGWFDSVQSQAIIKDMMATAVTYTEAHKLNGGDGPLFRNIDNKIPMADFAHQYQACEHFVKSSGSDEK
jgi:hypothetical protein